MQVVWAAYRCHLVWAGLMRCTSKVYEKHQRAHLSKPGMLGLGPDGHLAGACRDEQQRWERPGGRRKQDPAVNLKGVVGTGDVVKAKTPGDGVSLAAWRSQVPLDDVRPAQ